MPTSVQIGQSENYKLRNALLVYGRDDFNVYPPRHPFLTMHSVEEDPDGVRLGTGTLVTPDMLLNLMESLGQKTPMELFPEYVLARTLHTVIWWAPAAERTMFFNDRGQDATLRALNGKKYPHPALVFKVSGMNLSVRALECNERPTDTTKLYYAPYWNCAENGSVCTGSARIPQKKDVSAIPGWEQAFFESEFTHAGGNTSLTRHPKGFLAMWRYLQGKNKFPSRYLVPAKETLGKFATGVEDRA